MKTLRVWSPRPKLQSDAFESDFKNHPFITVYGKPVIDIEYCLPKNHANFLNFDGAFLTSQNAVLGLYQSKKDWQILSQKTCVAVGQATASLLKDLGVFVHYTANPPFNSESIVEDSNFNNLGISALAIISGQGGRRILLDYFLEKGLNAEKFIYYQRRKSLFFEDELLDFLRVNQINALTITSVEIANLVFDQLKALPSFDHILNDWVVFAFSPRISKACRELGFAQIQTITNASKSALYSQMQLHASKQANS